MKKAFVILLSILSGSFAVAEQPNIVFLLADDMSRNTWGVYGSVDCRTPNIDRLACDGMRFDRAYCSVAMCAPYRQELYTGRSPWRTGTLANHSKSVPDTRSIVHYLKPLGYRVALMGKSHVGPKNCYPFEYIKDGGDKKSDDNPIFLERTREFIDSCKEEGKPFCLFIASHDSHAPFTTGDPSAYDADKLTVPPYWLDTPELRDVLVEYYAEVTNFDALVGMIRGELEKQDLWKNTIFVVCSEQGTQLPFAKWTCYDQGLRSGLIVHWQGQTEPGSVAGELISIADITPTLVSAAGGRLKDGECDGKSFLDLLKGGKKGGNKYVYGAFTNCNIIDNRDRIYPIRVIRDKNYALIYNPKHKDITSNVTLTGALTMLEGAEPKKPDIGTSWVERSKTDADARALVHKLHHRPEFELYDLRQDPYELKNEIDNPEYKAVAERLRRQLMKKLSELGDGDPVGTETLLVKKKSGEGKKKGSD